MRGVSVPGRRAEAPRSSARCNTMEHKTEQHMTSHGGAKRVGLVNDAQYTTLQG